MNRSSIPSVRTTAPMFLAQFPGVHDLTRRSGADSGTLREFQPCLKRDFGHHWARKHTCVCVGSEAGSTLCNLCYLLLCILNKSWYLTCSNSLLRSCLHQCMILHFTEFTWMFINNLIEMSPLNMMNEWYCVLEFNYADQTRASITIEQPVLTNRPIPNV